MFHLSWQVRMLLLDAVNPPPKVVLPTVTPGLAGKVSVHVVLLVARFGVIHVNGLRMAVSEHFLIWTERVKPTKLFYLTTITK